MDQRGRDCDFKVSEYNDFLAKTTGTRSFPWLALVIASPEKLLTSTMLYTQAAPCRFMDKTRESGLGLVERMEYNRFSFQGGD